MSLPVRGAWIEIRRYIALTHGRPCRSPCGERGLKYHLHQRSSSAVPVAPRAGSVD